MSNEALADLVEGNPAGRRDATELARNLRAAGMAPMGGPRVPSSATTWTISEGVTCVKTVEKLRAMAGLSGAKAAEKKSITLTPANTVLKDCVWADKIVKRVATTGIQYFAGFPKRDQ